MLDDAVMVALIEKAQAEAREQMRIIGLFALEDLDTPSADLERFHRDDNLVMAGRLDHNAIDRMGRGAWPRKIRETISEMLKELFDELAEDGIFNNGTSKFFYEFDQDSWRIREANSRQICLHLAFWITFRPKRKPGRRLYRSCDPAASSDQILYG